MVCTVITGDARENLIKNFLTTSVFIKDPDVWRILRWPRWPVNYDMCFLHKVMTDNFYIKIFLAGYNYHVGSISYAHEKPEPGMRDKSTVKLQDVADKAGVSLMTASRVVRRSGLVAEKTRKHVELVISELGYIRNDLASCLASSNKTFCFVLVDRELGDSNFFKYVETIFERGMIPCVLFFGDESELNFNILRAKKVGSSEMYILFSEAKMNTRNILLNLNIINLADKIF